MAQRKRVLERRFAAEIDRRAAVEPGVDVIAMDVGDMLGIDAFEVVVVMTWLIGERLVMEAGKGPGNVPFPYTEEGLALTRRGREFAETGVVPPLYEAS